MPSKIGATIALDGEKEYRAAVKNCNTEMKLLKSELKLAAEQYSKNANSMKAYTQRQEILTKQVDQQKEKIATLKDALENAKKKYGENSDQVKSWQMQLNSAETDLSKLNRELDEVKRHTTGVGALKTEFGEVKEKIEQVREKTEGLRKVLGGIGKAAKTGIAVGAAAIAAVGTAAVSTGKQVWGMAKEVAEAGDAVDKGSQKLRVSAGDYQRMQYAAERSGTSIETLATAQKKLAASGTDMDLRQAIDQVASIEDADKRAAAATELFGKKAGQEMLPLLNQGKEGIAALYGEAEEYGMVMSDDAVKASAAFKDQLTKLQGTMTGLKNEMVGKLLPGLTSLSGGLTEIANGNADEGIRMISDGVKDLLGQVETLAPTVLQLGGELLKGIVTAILENLPELTAVGGPIVIELLTGIVAQSELLIEAALTLIQTLIDGLGDGNGDKMAKAALTIVQKLLTGLLRLLPELLNVGIDLILALVNGLSDPGVLGEILQAAIECALQLVAGLLKSVPRVLEAGVNLVKGLWQGITNSLEWLKGKIKGWVGNVIDFIKNLFGIHSPSSLMRDEVGKNLMLGIGAGIDAYAGIPQEAIDKATASLTATAGMTYQVGYIHDQIAAAAPPTAVTYSTTGGNGPTPGGTPLETVIALLQVIAANSEKQIVLSDGTLFGWLNAALGRGADDDGRGVTV